MKLSSIEMCFQNYLQTKHPEIKNQIVENTQLGAMDRLDIYFNAYRVRLFEILESDYPKLLILMGQKDFQALAEIYLNHHPSRFFSVRYFGQHLASFLKTTQPYCNYPYLQEMALFEWAMGNTLDAADAPLLQEDAMKSMPLQRFSELKLGFHPSVQLLYFTWDIPEIWQEIEQNAEERYPKKYSSPTAWLVFRSELSCAFRSMNSEEAFALQTMLTSSCIEMFCETLCEQMPEDRIPLFTLQCLEQWLRDGIISEII